MRNYNVVLDCLNYIEQFHLLYHYTEIKILEE